jgi:hypothetical protein
MELFGRISKYQNDMVDGLAKLKRILFTLLLVLERINQATLYCSVCVTKNVLRK